MSRGQVLANIPEFSESSSTLKNTLVSFGLDFFRWNKPTNSNQLGASGLKEKDRCSRKIVEWISETIH